MGSVEGNKAVRSGVPFPSARNLAQAENDKTAPRANSASNEATSSTPPVTRESLNCDAFENGPPTPPAWTSAPKTLEPILQGIGLYTAADLTAAATTVAGEITQDPHEPALHQEAKGVASTLFNRQKDIASAREAFALAKQKVVQAQEKNDQARLLSEEWGKNETKHLKELRAPGRSEQQVRQLYKEKGQELQTAYDTAHQELNAAQKAQTKAATAKRQAESYLSPEDSSLPSPPLDRITHAHTRARNPKTGEFQEQLEGTKKGEGYLTNYPAENETAKRIRAQVWDVAKTSVMCIAADPSKTDSFRFFVAADQGNGLRKKDPGDVRRGGTDFWENYKANKDTQGRS